ncbi:glucosaminidase domain-containing protein, partial [Propionibacterium freudenreichii]|uniref:glucosaminidase domain-containing protein n=1 Tax=Propionibacterium freudenreichii TaxID=1744 RepID=UPI003853A922
KLPDGWYQQFQNAGIYWTNDGGKVVTGDVAAKYAALGKTASTTATASSTPSAINATSAADATTKTSSNSSAANTTSAKSTAQPTTAATSSSTPIASGSVSASSSSSASTTNPAAAAPSTTQSPNAQTPSTQAPTSAIADATSTAQETTTVGAIAVWYNSLGGVNSYLGAPTSPEIPTTGGVYQVFQGGRIYWNEALGAYDVHGAVLLEYLSLNGSDGELGMPATPEVPVPGGTYQVFQNGWIYWSEPNGAHWLHGATLAEYQAIAGTNSYLGFPTSDERSAAGGTVQDFEHGKIYWNPSTGAHAVHGAVLTEFGNNGAEGGWPGYPTTDELLLAEGVVQHFQGGLVYWNASAGAHVVRGTIGDTYAANGWEWGFLGYPTSSERPVSNGGVVQDFQNGKIYWSPGNGAYAIHNAVLTEYQNTGWEWGILGFPTSEEQSLDNGIVQHFQGGNVYWNASAGAHVVRGTIGDTYAANGWEWGFLGYPTSSERPVSNGGVVQDFQNGKIYWSPGNGAYAIHNAVLTEYQNTGWEWGILGFPTSEEQSLDNGIVQHFQGGLVYWSPDVGAHAIHGEILRALSANDWEWGPLGYPTTGELPGGEGVVQYFQKGNISWVAGRGAVVNVINTGGPKPAAGDEAGYIRWVAGFAQEEQRRYGVPAAVSIAQSILESGWGQSSLTAVDNNYFGIKCPAYGSPFVSGCTSYSTNEWVNGGYVTIQAGFRSYNSPADSFLDHGFFLSLGDPKNSANRYYPAFLTTNDRDFVRAIAAAGYATDPTYANKIIGFMDRYNLYQYDV